MSAIHFGRVEDNSEGPSGRCLDRRTLRKAAHVPRGGRGTEEKGFDATCFLVGQVTSRLDRLDAAPSPQAVWGSGVSLDAQAARKLVLEDVDGFRGFGFPERHEQVDALAL